MSRAPPFRITKNVEKVARSLFRDDEERAAFLTYLSTDETARPSLLWLEDPPHPPPFQLQERHALQPPFVEVPLAAERPGKNPHHEAGRFYCLDLSSAMLASVFGRLSAIERVIDVCAAPGGKSLFAWRALHPATLIANEVIGKRLAMLISNFKRCHVPALVASRDSKLLADSLPAWADLVIVDAPCSGQSLVGRAQSASGAFHPSTINMNSNRQKRILANSAALVARGGYLAYLTCTFSLEENEHVVEWFLDRFSGFDSIAVAELEPLRSKYSHRPSYRIFPGDGLGSGGFAALFRNTRGRQDRLTHDLALQPWAWRGR